MKPIRARVREMVHEVCPDVQETIKWSSPFFDYKGQMMCAIAAFKQHCAFGVWKGRVCTTTKELTLKSPLSFS